MSASLAALDAPAAGAEMLVLEDCCASVPAQWHRFSVEHILPLLVTVTTSEALA